MPSVLVIDDEQAIRESIRQVLDRAGFEVATADNGITGIEGYFEHPADVVIVDIIMPRSDGIAVITKIRASCPNARIIAMTGGGNFWPVGYQPNTLVTDAYLTLASKSGANVVMKKPFRRQDLLETVRGLVDSDERA
ncbi:MAG TPA: response regulator [Steroidobacteraceae bacterium]|jgi:DNA-binding NtrC family response regulator